VTAPPAPNVNPSRLALGWLCSGLARLRPGSCSGIWLVVAR
jgi:hypothetical protein